MSFQATNWALAQQCGSPSAKVTLLCLAHYASDQNLSWPSQATIARETEQSIDTVARRLRELEEAGLIEREGHFPRADGGNSSVIYRMMFDLTKHDQDLRANRTKKGKTPPANCGEGMPQDAGGYTAPGAGGSPANCGTNNIKELPEEYTPPNPQGGMGGAENQPSEEKDPFDRFRQAWVVDPTISWEVVERRFHDLSPDEQELAARTAPRYIAWCEKHGRKLKGPVNWLRGKGWQGFAEDERATAAAVQIAQTKVWVREGSPQWQAIARAFDRSRKRMPAPMACKAEPGLGWWFDAELLREHAA